jgi:hypothetical protein
MRASVQLWKAPVRELPPDDVARFGEVFAALREIRANATNPRDADRADRLLRRCARLNSEQAQREKREHGEQDDDDVR